MRIFLYALGVSFFAACALLGPADRADLVDTAATLERCQELGRACKADGGTNCFQVYSACVGDAGLVQ